MCTDTYNNESNIDEKPQQFLRTILLYNIFFSERLYIL